MIALTLYSKPGCHLCDDMKVVIDRVISSLAESVTIEIVNITTDPALEARYGLEIPVLLVNGKKAAKARITEDELRRVLAGRELKG